MARVCIFGDSITWGAWDLEMGGWVSRLRVLMDNKKRDDYEIYNLGVSGDKTADVLMRFDVEADAREPGVIVIAIGINDSKHKDYAGTPLDEFKEQFSELLEKALQRTKKVIVLSPTNVVGHPDNSYRDEYIRPYVEAVEELSQEKQASFLSLFGILTEEDLQIDGLHPNASGHVKISDKVGSNLNSD